LQEKFSEKLNGAEVGNNLIDGHLASILSSAPKIAVPKLATT